MYGSPQEGALGHVPPTDREKREFGLESLVIFSPQIGQEIVINSTMIYEISIWLLPVLIAVTFHEAAHGYVARALGDETASRLGRVSLNPLRHIDPFGTIVMPGLLLLAHSPFLFGYAKPVPVNFRALRNPRSGMVLVAAAGPAMNIGLAIIAALSFHLVVYLPESLVNGLP
jgi:Zn-dependent protease